MQRQRLLNILLIVVIVMLGFSLGRMTGNGLLPVGEDAEKEYPLPPPPPQPTVVERMDDVAERKLIVETPADGASVTNGMVIVSGRADSASITGVTVTVRDTDGVTVLETVASLRPNGGFARFSEPLALGTESDRFTITIIGRAAGGEVVEEVVRELVSVRQDTITVDVHFQNAGTDPDADVCVTTYGVARAVPSATNVYRATVEALLAGPTPAERNAGYATSVPANVILKDIGADANGIVTANFNATLDRGIAGSCRVGAIRTQIERTLLQFPEVRGVVIQVEGNSDEALQP